MNFSELKVNEKIVEVLKSKNIIEPTEIQLKTFPLAANGHDVIGVSQTGSGKTLAFILPIIDQLLKTQKPFHTLVVVPTRELALQISECVAMFEGFNIRHSLLIGGDNFVEQVNSINKKPNIVIGTPGRIVKHIKKTKNLRMDSFRKLILDEADRFFEQDFTDELNLISQKLKRKNQSLMFTATITDKTEKLSSIFMKNPRLVEISGRFENVKTLKDYFSFIPEKYKLTVLYNYLKQNEGSAIIFVGMCTSSQKIGTFLQKMGISCEFLHGSMPQNRREERIKDFKESNFDVLVSTDLASRGLDIPHVDLVINYDLPSTAKDYMHRVGRTARAGKEGVAVSFVTQYDVVEFQKLEFVLKRKIEKKRFKSF